jgi:hypothetical protein
VFSRPLVFLTIPKACGFEAATRFTSTLIGGSLILIVVIGMGMALTAFGFRLCVYYHRDLGRINNRCLAKRCINDY